MNDASHRSPADAPPQAAPGLASGATAVAAFLDACPLCGSRQLQALRCKTICGNCRTILQSCADL
ncbi:MAG: hypothetical protein U0164_21785 [Gemmatimonadaceae bacterium]